LNRYCLYIAFILTCVSVHACNAPPRSFLTAFPWEGQEIGKITFQSLFMLMTVRPTFSASKPPRRQCRENVGATQRAEALPDVRPLHLAAEQLPEMTVHERYATIVKDMQQIARACLIFGLHVHVTIPDREEGIDIMNQARYFLPHLYALSVNSPFWLGQNTGLKAYRHMIFERFPRTGIPDAFESLSEYEDYLKLLVSTNCIDNAKKIWWDVRLHPFFDTIEFRICDAQSRVDDTIALAALMQAIVFKLQKLRRDNVTFRSYPKRLLDENRWRTSRYGLDGKLIDFGRRCEVDERDLLHEMLDFVSTEVEELGNQREMAHVERIVREGTGADRQLMVWERTQDMKAVVDQIVAETNEGLAV
jgi:carboxylate-amine ligase